MNIALTRASGSPGYENYIKWLHAAAEQTQTELECIDLWSVSAVASQERAVELLADCSALVITGGPDVDPACYGKEHERGRCYMDAERDTLEFSALEKALSLGMPILGICRGAQLINVHLGGSLIVDIPEDTGTAIEHRQVNNVDGTHEIEVEPGTILKKICGTLEGTINSAHHQAVDTIAEHLRIIARAPDGIVEAFERDDASKGFLLGVQWHPERLDYTNPFSLPIAKHLLFEAESYDLLVRNNDRKTA